MKKFMAWLLRTVGGTALMVWFMFAIVAVIIGLCTLVLSCLPLMLAEWLVRTSQDESLPEVDAARSKIVAFPAIEP